MRVKEEGRRPNTTSKGKGKRARVYRTYKGQSSLVTLLLHIKGLLRRNLMCLILGSEKQWRKREREEGGRSLNRRECRLPFVER